MTLDDLLIHPHTKEQLNRFIRSPSQALLITGAIGSGKTATAFALSSKLLELPENKETQSHPYFMHLTRLKNKKDISIEQVRAVTSALKLKVPGKKSIRRVVFIEDAHYLSRPAQNALLKMLEEPNNETVFILSSTSERSVLPTIASRTQQISIKPIGLALAQEFWSKYPHQTVESAWRLSRGTPGLLNSLLLGEEHPLKSAVSKIKTFLRGNKYERILFIDKLSRNREDFVYFLDALGRTLSVLHHQAIIKDQKKQAKALLLSRKYVLEAKKALDANANSRLVALNLSLNISI
jgi:hypothetical protein